LLRACKTITKPKPCFSKKAEDSVASSARGRFIGAFKGTAAPGCAVDDSAASAEEAIGVEILTQCPLGPGIFALDMMTEYAFDSDLTNSMFQFFQINGRLLQIIVDQLSCHAVAAAIPISSPAPSGDYDCVRSRFAKPMRCRFPTHHKEKTLKNSTKYGNSFWPRKLDFAQLLWYYFMPIITYNNIKKLGCPKKALGPPGICGLHLPLRMDLLTCVMRGGPLLVALPGLANIFGVFITHV
jgi:hypothetical protein